MTANPSNPWLIVSVILHPPVLRWHSEQSDSARRAEGPIPKPGWWWFVGAGRVLEVPALCLAALQVGHGCHWHPHPQLLQQHTSLQIKTTRKKYARHEQLQELKIFKLLTSKMSIWNRKRVLHWTYSNRTMIFFTYTYIPYSIFFLLYTYYFLWTMRRNNKIIMFSLLQNIIFVNYVCSWKFLFLQQSTWKEVTANSYISLFLVQQILNNINFFNMLSISHRMI